MTQHDTDSNNSLSVAAVEIKRAMRHDASRVTVKSVKSGGGVSCHLEARRLAVQVWNRRPRKDHKARASMRTVRETVSCLRNLAIGKRLASGVAGRCEFGWKKVSRSGGARQGRTYME